MPRNSRLIVAGLLVFEQPFSPLVDCMSDASSAKGTFVVSDLQLLCSYSARSSEYYKGRRRCVKAEQSTIPLLPPLHHQDKYYPTTCPGPALQLLSGPPMVDRNTQILLRGRQTLPPPAFSLLPQGLRRLHLLPRWLNSKPARPARPAEIRVARPGRVQIDDLLATIEGLYDGCGGRRR